IGVIAVALAKMAFFPSGDEDDARGTITPGSEVDEYALVAAESGDVSSTMELPGTVVADEGIPLEATASGEINKIWRHEGDRVAEGEQVLQVRYPVEPEPQPEPPTETADGADTDSGADGAGDASDAGGNGDASDAAAEGASEGATDDGASDDGAEGGTEYRYAT